MANRSPAAKRRAASPVSRRDGSTPTSPVHSASKASRSSQAGGFGLFLLLLAAMPFGDERNGGDDALDSGDCPKGSRPSLASASNLRYAASFEDMLRAGSRLLDFDNDFDDDENDDNNDCDSDLTDEERRRRRKLRKMQKKQQEQQQMLVRTGPNSVFGSLVQGLGDKTVSTFASEESTEGMDRDDSRSEVLSHYTDEVSSSFCSDALLNHPIHTLSDLSRECLSMAMGYLPLRDVNRCRSVSSSFNWAALTDVPSPLPGSLFMRFENTHRGGSFSTPPSRQVLKWICNFCNTQNNVNFNTCRSCGGGNADCLGVRKVFLGQLRKERTTELVDWLLNRLFPEMKPLHIENHTGKDNRGKGCAWVYVTSAEDEAKILSLNKRMFVDVDDDGKEGVWFCEDSYAKELNAMATDRAYKPKRPIVLPRQPLTAEKPGAKPSPPSKGHNASPTSGYSTHWTNSSGGADVKERPSPDASAQELYEKYTPASTEQPPAAASKPSAAKKGAKKNIIPPAPRQQQQREMQSQSSAYRSDQQYQYQPNSINVFDYPYTAEELYNAQYGGASSQPQQQQYNDQQQQQHYSHNPYGFNPVQMPSSDQEDEFADAATYQFVDMNRMQARYNDNTFQQQQQQRYQQYSYYYQQQNGEMM